MRDAMEWLDEQQRVDDLALFLDFDGTLAPIVERPDDARALDGICELVEAVAAVIPVAVISGRGLDDIMERLGARGIYYSGSHGLEMEGPDGTRRELDELRALVPQIDQQEARLRHRFAEVEGVEIERKRYGVAVHFRRRPEAQRKVEEAVEQAVRSSEGLKWETGKMVREVQPDVDLHKGTALRSIWGQIDPDGHRRPLYIGDDRTDEDAFETIADGGVGILVSDAPRPSAASLRLADPRRVREFLKALAAGIGAISSDQE